MRSFRNTLLLSRNMLARLKLRFYCRTDVKLPVRRLLSEQKV